MSISKGKDVPQLVEKYRQQYPDLDRDLLRKLIRLENKIENPSELKKLDRYLAKAFKNKVSIEKPSSEYDNYVKELEEIETLSEWAIDSAWHKLLLLHTHLPPKLKTKVWERLRSIVYNYHPGNYKYGEHGILDLKKALDIVYEDLQEYYRNPEKVSE